jgi:FkbM family methyltransferase
MQVMRQILKGINQMLHPLGGQILSTGAARHISLTKMIQQTGAQIEVLEYLILTEIARLSGKPFNIVQIGANDGCRYDPYRKYIERFKLSGVLVEPLPEIYQKLLDNYKDQPQLAFENAAIGPEDGNMPLYRLTENGKGSDGMSVYASFSRSQVEKFRDLAHNPMEIEAVNVPVMTFDTLIKKHDIDHVSLLAIDTEGFDFEIIKSIDFEKTKPRIIEYEHTHLSRNDEKECVQLLVSEGYKVLRSFGDDTLAVLHKSDVMVS